MSKCGRSKAKDTGPLVTPSQVCAHICVANGLASPVVFQGVCALIYNEDLESAAQ